MGEIACTVVIVNWKSISLLRDCIRSIQENTKLKHEIIVVDNASGREEQEELKGIKDIILILNEQNRGFAAANNQALEIARGEFVFMLNPDTIILNEAIEKLINFLENEKNAYAVGPKLYGSSNLDYHPSVKKIPTPFVQFLWMLPLSGWIRSIISHYTFERDKIQKAECVWGAAIMFKNEVFKRIGYFDERFFLYAEEVDFCKRMKLNNLDLYYFPEAEIIHFKGKSQQQSVIPKNIYIWESQITFFNKYFSRMNTSINMILIFLILKLKIKFFKQNDFLPVLDVICKKIIKRSQG